MKRIVQAALALALLSLTPMASPLGSSTAWAADSSFGAGLTGTETTRISELLAKPETYVGKVVRVEGLVTDVCAKRGCWVAIASDQEFQTLRFKVKDGDMVFTPDVKGRKGVFEGVFNRYELSVEQAVEQAKHHAEEQGQAFDPSTVTGPEVWYQLDGTGAVVR